MIFASKSTLSLNNLVIRPKVKKNLTNLCKKFIGFPPSFLAFFSRKYNYEKSQLFDTILCFVEKRKKYESEIQILDQLLVFCKILFFLVLGKLFQGKEHLQM